MNSIPASRRKNLIIGGSFSILNSVFFIRLIWQLVHKNYGQSSLIFLIVILIIQITFIFCGFKLHLVEKFLKVISSTLSPFFIFAIFYLIKKGLKELLVFQSKSFKLDIGSWFISIFLWIVLILIIQLISHLAHRTRKQSILPISKPLLVVFLLTVISLMSYWFYTQIFNPLPSYANYDPEISYLVNSLTPFKDLELYRRMDHPVRSCN